VVRGEEYELDCLIYATGFEVGTDYSRRAGLKLIGREGKSLTEAWSAGVRTMHGMHVHGFPNCFVMNNTQSGFTASYPHMLDEQARHIAYILETAAAREANLVEVTAEGEENWVAHCVQKARARGDYFENCTPGYYNNEGRLGDRNEQNGFYGGGPVAFFNLLREWREDGRLDGLSLG
jgi:cyclohexanone monooxygenase